MQAIFASSTQCTFHAPYPADSFIKKETLHKMNWVEMQWNHCVDGVVWLVEGCWCTKPLWHCQQQGGDCLILKRHLLFLCHGWDPVFVGNWFALKLSALKFHTHASNTHMWCSKLKVPLTEMHRPLRSPSKADPQMPNKQNAMLMKICGLSFIFALCAF